ncbi:MAG: hypothetical protein C4519_09450 [Desulfobacteraceae bacterium]|nr:MAG: hypothetical protein C4519_09450 [Desulfobacteraceae bacterium]
MKKMLFLVSIALFSVIMVNGVQAAITLSLVPVQGSSVLVGNQFDLDLILNTDTAGLFGGTLSFTFNPALVTFQGLTPGADIDTAAAYPDSTIDFSTPDFTNGFAINQDLDIGTLSFLAQDIGTADFALSAISPWFDINFDEVFASLSFNEVGTSVSVNAVPIPGSLLLLGSGLISLVGLGRKKRS